MKGLVKRHIEGLARRMLAASPGLVIEGARQVGKSTLARQLLEGSDAVHVTLDDEYVRAAAVDDMAGFVAQAPGRTLVIDELQRLPALTVAIKAAIDRNRIPGQFVLTGSASLLRVRGLADSLAGRVMRLSMYGFSQGEMAGMDDDFVARLLDLDPSSLSDYRAQHTRADYLDAVVRGAYPEAQRFDADLRGHWFDAYVDGVVRRDLGELRREVDPSRAESLLRVIAANQAGELVKARIAAAASIPERTVTGYLDLLRDVGLVETWGPFTPNLTSREVGRHKAVIVDSGLCARLLGLDVPQLGRFDRGEVLGQLLEGFVATELRRQRTWSSQPYDLRHYRNRLGVEVDLVAELADGRVIGVEVKASTSFNRNQFSGLKVLRDALGDRFVMGIVLNTGTHGFRLGDRLYGLPIDALWRLA